MSTQSWALLIGVAIFVLKVFVAVAVLVLAAKLLF